MPRGSAKRVRDSCEECGDPCWPEELCSSCQKCDACCECMDLFDADEMGLDPEEDQCRD